MEAPHTRRVVIVGGGTAGWMTAAALSAKLGRSVAITLVESAAIGTVGVGEATIPHIRHFNDALGLDEADFMARTNATFKLGIEFRDWGRIGDSYLHPFGAFGERVAGVDFHHHWLRLHRAGRVAPFDAFSLPILAARAGRFAPPDAAGDPLLGGYAYAYQFDAALYGRYLRAYAEARGVGRREGRVIDVTVRDDGCVDHVLLDDGEAIGGDLFVDCSGFRGLLIEQALRAGYDDWRHWLPCDRAIALPTPTTGPILPYTRATALAAGWAWRIPLQHRVGNGHVYAAAFLDDDAALDALLGQLDAAPLAEPNRLRFVTGRRRRQWIGNTVAIGLSAGFLEPLESTSIHLIQLAIGRLLDLWPQGRCDPRDAAAFNRLMDLEYERVRDFLILHYHASARDDSPFWRHCRAMALPDSLAARLALFRERGVVSPYRQGTFLEPSWLAVLLGQGVMPARIDPRTRALAETDAAARLDAMAARYAAAAATLPRHADARGRAA